MDDQEEILGVLASMLGHLGYGVETAKNGESAIDLFSQAQKEGSTFDAVILDLTVRNGMGGLETLKRLLKLDPGVKAVVSSGYSHDPIMDDHRSYGFSAIIAKPYTLGQLEEVLRRLLEA
jgi:CheY-like chemotaxis protein